MNQPIKFGIISEGLTDQKVLENILIGYFDDLDLEKIVVNPIQPDSGETFGGWTSALDYIQSDKFKKGLALGSNDYYIIQIDTDICEDAFGITPINEKNMDQLHEFTTQIKEAIISNYIGKDVFSLYENQFIFAISVHSIECWLLPLYLTSTKQRKLLKCIEVLQKALKQKNSKVNLHAKRPRDYDNISSAFYKRKKLVQAYEKHPSLKLFVDTLESIFHEFES